MMRKELLSELSESQELGPPTLSEVTLPDSQRITRADVSHVAKLARLMLDDAQLDRFTGQLDSVLEHAADLETLDLENVAPLANPFPLTNVLRPDTFEDLQSSPDICSEVLDAAPSVEDGQFRVPPVLGEIQ